MKSYSLSPESVDFLETLRKKRRARSVSFVLEEILQAVRAKPKRNRRARADTVLVVPLTTSVHKDAATHVFLSAGETGLQSDSAARAEDKVSIAMGCAP